ncbi:helix-turn-helix domain-containing protein [Larkinella punicea]|uniref:DNA-binding protein n=1 Tax=Larkinella punicea TaxID=2315727 RepID=A0A368JD07_9BACT|nr:helix-turn-helix domain-containing protein [Larkinella punicea]RCR65549.1 DNA-binding protein [Larkinella punicea]
MNQILLSGMELSELLNSIRHIVQEAFFTFQSTPPVQPSNRMGGIGLAREVTGLATSTLYNLVAQNKIPHCKRGGKLFFMEEELHQWILAGRRKTTAEVATDVDAFLCRHPKGKAKIS